MIFFLFVLCASEINAPLYGFLLFLFLDALFVSLRDAGQTRSCSYRTRVYGDETQARDAHSNIFLTERFA